jgi:hypothetical protein
MRSHLERQTSHTMTLQSAIIFFCLTLVLSIVTHCFVRHYVPAVLISTATASLANIIHEAFLHDFQVRPVDLIYWIPMEFALGMLLALPVAALVGISFYFLRGRRKLNPS